MSTEKKILFKQQERLNHGKIELAAINDIEKILNRAISEKNRLSTQIIKLSNDLLNLTSDFSRAKIIAIDSQNKAKDLGSNELVKLFGNRKDEAEDYEKLVGKLSVRIENIARQL